MAIVQPTAPHLRSENASEYIQERPAQSLHGWFILCDVEVTRRKRFHIVHCGAGFARYRSTRIWDCIGFLDTMGVEEYELRAPYVAGSIMRQISRATLKD